METVHLTHSEKGSQLTDSNPHRVKDSNVHGKIFWKEAIGTSPLFFVQTFLSIPTFRKWARVERRDLYYCTCVEPYDSIQTQDLRGSGISCPPMVQFYKEQKNDPNKISRSDKETFTWNPITHSSAASVIFLEQT